MPEDALATPRIKWYYRRWFVLLMLSPVCLGPFGLPLLWRSSQFSLRAKWIWSLLVIAVTIWLTFAIIDAARAVVRHFQELLPAL